MEANVGNLESSKHFLKDHNAGSILAHINFIFEEEESLEDLLAHSNLVIFREVLFIILEKNPKQKSFAYYHRLQISPNKAPIYLLDEVFSHLVSLHFSYIPVRQSTMLTRV
jgi:hypothetical protein